MVSLKCQQLLVQFYNNLYPINYGLATTKPVFCNRLVVISSWNPLDLATSFGFNDPDPSDGGWSQNPMLTVVRSRTLLVPNKGLPANGHIH